MGSTPTGHPSLRPAQDGPERKSNGPGALGSTDTRQRRARIAQRFYFRET